MESNQKLSTELGTTFAELVDLAGGIYIRKEQADAVRRIVAQADPVIGEVSNKILTFLQDTTGAGNLKQLLAFEKAQLSVNYDRYLGLNAERIRLRSQRDTVSGTISRERFATLADDQTCLQLLQNLTAADQLRTQCITAVTNLRKAHANLLADIQEKKKLSELYAEVQLYAGDIQQMNTTIKTIK